MDKSFLWQNELPRTLNKDEVSVNAYTRRLLYTRPLLTASFGNFSIPLSVSFNSNYQENDYSDFTIGSNGWKLNIDQYLFPYNNSYLYFGFKVGDYVYIDGTWKIHRFIKYSTKTINNQSVNCYYDYYNDSLRLYVYLDGTADIVDLNNNKYCFNVNGRLSKIVSGINSQITKEITYNQDKITSIYDTRDSSIGFTFTYTDNLLTKIVNKQDNNTIKFEYTYFNKVSKIKQTYRNKTRELVEYNYDLYFNLKNVIDCQTKVGFDIDYEKVDNNYLVAMIQEVTSKIEPTHISGNALHSSNKLYVEQGKYYEKTAKYYDGDIKTIDTSNPRNQIIYYNEGNNLVVQKPNAYEIVYFFDRYGRVISQLEKKSSNQYKTLFKTNGWLLSENGTGTDTINNNNATILSNKKFTVNVNDNNMNNNFHQFMELFKYDTSFIRNNNVEDFYVGFWLKTDQTIYDDLEHELKFTYDSKSISKKFRISLSKPNSWQYVKVPIVLFEHEENVKQLDIIFDGSINYGNIYIADVRIGIGTNNRVYIKNKCLDDAYTVIYQLNDYAVNINKNVYLTSSDVEKTYRSLYLSQYENQSSFDLTCCNGRYVLDVKQVKLDDSDDLKFTIDDNGIPNFRTQVSYKEKEGSFDIVEQQHRYTYSTDINRHIHEIKTSYDKVNDREDTQKESRSYRYYTRNSFDGLKYSEQDRHDLIVDYSYDDYGNLMSEVTKNENDNDNRIEKTYSYHDSNTKFRKQPYIVSDINNSVEYVYDNYYGFVKEITSGEIKVVYEYDHFNECLNTIKFINKSTGEVLKTHNLLNSNNMLSRIINNNNNKYQYFYNDDLEVNKVYDDHNLLFEIQKQKDSSELIVTEIKKEYNGNNTGTLDYVKKYHYDKYDRLKLLEEGIDILSKDETEIDYQGEVVIYEENGTDEDKSRYYNDYLKNAESSLVQKPLTVYDPYRKVLIVFYYDGSNNVIGYDERSIDYISSKRRFIEKYLVDEHKTRFTLYDYNGVYNNLVYYLNCTYDTDTNKINAPDKRVLKTYYTLQSGVNEMLFPYVYETNYQYDNFGKLIKLNYIDPTSSQRFHYIDLNYDENTNLLNQRILNSTSDKLLNRNSTLTETLEYDIIKKTNNITKITETGSIALQSISSLDVSKTKEYEYNDIGNLTKETINGQDTYEYEYDTWGNLTKVTKNNQTQKEFTYNHDRLLTYKLNNVYKNINYDLRGNITEIGNKHFIFNTQNLLEKYECDAMPDSCFYYYYSNEGILYRKIKKTLVDGNYEIDYDINYYLDNDKILAEFKETSEGIKKIQYFYDLTGISSILYNNKVYNLVKDSLGSISKVIRDGLILAEYDYDAWGNSTTNYIQNDLSDDDNYIINNNPFRYRGYYYDVETGLFYCKSRYYSPELCRFISPDSIEYLDPQSINGLNLYCYCMNNPIMYADPSGHFLIWVFLGIVAISAIAGAIDGGVTAEISGQNFWKGFAAGAIGGAVGGAINYFLPGAGNLLGRAASTMIYDITNEIFQTGTFDINNLGLYVVDTFMDVTLSLLYLDKVGSIANPFISAAVGGTIDAVVDIIQTPLYFSPQAQQRIRGANNKNNRTNSIFANRLTYAY